MTTAHSTRRDPRFVNTAVAVIGGGIFGAWLAYQLAHNDVPVVVVTDDEHMPPLSRTSAAGVIRQQVLECTNHGESTTFADTSTTQAPGYRRLMPDWVGDQFVALTELIDSQTM